MSTDIQEKSPAPAAADAPLGLRRRSDGRLVVDRDGAELPLKASHAFPWKSPRNYISLRDDKGKETIFVESLDALGGTDRELLEEELGFRTHIARISRIRFLKEVVEDWWWDVDTDCGRRNFLQSRHDEPRILPDGRVLIKDRYGELYLIEDPKALDRTSQARFFEVVDYIKQ